MKKKKQAFVEKAHQFSAFTRKFQQPRFIIGYKSNKVQLFFPYRSFFKDKKKRKKKKSTKKYERLKVIKNVYFSTGAKVRHHLPSGDQNQTLNQLANASISHQDTFWNSFLYEEKKKKTHTQSDNTFQHTADFTFVAKARRIDTLIPKQARKMLGVGGRKTKRTVDGARLLLNC